MNTCTALLYCASAGYVPVLVAVGVVAAVAAAAAVALALADAKLGVKEDPRIGLVTGELPGANCGGCGFAGCGDYAKAMVEGRARPGACGVCTAESRVRIGEILGVSADATQKRVAIVHCSGDRSKAIRVGDYNGICDCAAAAAVSGGDKGCRFGCLGYGACAHVCPQNAIRVENGLAVVEKRLCIGCGKCVAVCPRKLIELVPAAATIHVLCNNPLRGPGVTKVCEVGCMGCHLCEKTAGGPESGHFYFNGFLAKVNYANPPADHAVVASCPRHTIREDDHFETGA